MEKQNCDIQLQENLFKGSRVDWNYFVGLMHSSPDNDISIYGSTKDALVFMGRLSRETGFAVYADGILSRNPREAINCGNQLYFPSRVDAGLYAKALVGTDDIEDCCYTIEDISERRV